MPPGTDNRHPEETASQSPVAVVGAGSIGVAWAVVFARAGIPVVLHDADRVRLAASVPDLRARLDALAAEGLLLEPAETVAERVVAESALDAAVRGARHVQECVAEDLALKRDVFSALDTLAAPGVPIASSSSMLTATRIAAELRGRDRCLVAHPGNPPYLLPIVELVPAPFTAPDVLERAAGYFTQAGLWAVRVRREIEGFVFNRLQGALLREAYCLVRDGVVSPSELDRLVQEGLGRRWSVIGPFATAELNTRGGIEAHAARLGPAYARMGAERGQHDPWTSELVAEVAADVHARFAPERWDENVTWRDRQLMVLERARAAAEPHPPDSVNRPS